MGIQSHPISSDRHFFPGNPGTTSPTRSSSQMFIKKLIVRTTGIVAIASLIGIATAADTTDNEQPTPANSNLKSSSAIELTPSTANDTSVGNGTTSTSTTSVSHSVIDGKSSVQATVNGQPIDVPENGTNQQTITTPDGSTTVTVTNNSSSQGTNYSSNSTTVHRNNMTLDSSVTSRSESVDGAP